MSTKIFNGYRLARGTDSLTLARGLYETFLPSAIQYARESTALTAIMLHQQAKGLDDSVEADEARTALLSETVARMVGEDEGRAMVMRDGLRRARARASVADLAHTLVMSSNRWLSGGGSRRRSPLVDMSVSVAFLSDPKSPRQHYALLYAEGSRYTEAWEALPGVEPWPYWNNTDRPDEVTAAQWNRRRDVWDRLLGYDAPAKRGLTWELSMSEVQYETLVPQREQFTPEALAALLLQQVETAESEEALAKHLTHPFGIRPKNR